MSFNPKSHMFAKVVLASKADHAPPIYTMHLRYPRIIHGEIMTHRLFSRNARSSRAVPVKTMLEEIRTVPFVPWHWGKNQKGMQAVEENSERVIVPDIAGHTAGEAVDREAAWLWARDAAADMAEAFMNAGYHKQVVNRLVEPFSWIDTLITSTDWKNFFHLRDHADAEPHFRDLAVLVKEAMTYAEFQMVETGGWHLPYIDGEDVYDVAKRPTDHTKTLMAKRNIDPGNVLARLSAARCARISYKPFDGNGSIEAELDRYDMLVGNSAVHASPLEHQASPDHMIVENGSWSNPELHGNLNGWIQFRKLIPNEAVHG